MAGLLGLAVDAHGGARRWSPAMEPELSVHGPGHDSSAWGFDRQIPGEY
jgi:hypothetical protein